MRLAFVSSYITSGVSCDFYSSQQLNLARWFTRKGHDVTIYTLNLEENTRSVDVVESGSLTIVRLPSSFSRLEKSGVPMLRGMTRAVKEGRHDVLLVSGDYHPTPFQVILSDVPAKKVLFQGIYQYSRRLPRRVMMKLYDRLITPLMIRKIDLVIAKTTAAATFMRDLGYDRVVNIPVGYAPDVFQPVDEQDCLALKERLGLAKARVVLYVGNLIQRRRVDLLIRAMAHVCSECSEAHLLIVGQGPEDHRLKALSSLLGIDGRVSFIDRVPNKRLKDYYSMAECLVLCSDYEIFGMVLPEAVGCGCPIVCTPIPAAKDIVDSSNGIIVPFGDHDALARAIARILSGSTLSDRSAVARSVEALQWENLADRYLRSFEELYR